jgi:hypothetical protein
MKILLYYEMNEISTNHSYIIAMYLGSLAVYFYRFRTNVPMKQNTMLHGPPGKQRFAAVPQIFLTFFFKFLCDGTA